MNIRYRVTLTADERLQLETMIQRGKVAVRKIKRAQILLAADQGSTDEAIASNVAVGTSTVYRTKLQFVEEGLERALSGRSFVPWRARHRQRGGLTGRCSCSPTRWSV
jgi:transposase